MIYFTYRVRNLPYKENTLKADHTIHIKLIKALNRDNSHLLIILDSQLHNLLDVKFCSELDIFTYVTKLLVKWFIHCKNGQWLFCWSRFNNASLWWPRLCYFLSAVMKTIARTTTCGPTWRTAHSSQAFHVSPLSVFSGLWPSPLSPLKTPRDQYCKTFLFGQNWQHRSFW